MTGSNSFWLANPGKSFYNNVVQQSLRADDGDNPLLSKSAFASAGNRKTWTLSIWFKRGNNVNGALFSAPINGSTNGFSLYFDADQLVLFEYKNTGQSSFFKLTSSAALRDTTNWYHLVAIFDTNSSGGGSSDTGASARVRMYLNGRLMDVSLTGSIGADYESLTWNNTYVHEILNQRTSTFPYDGYIAEVNFLDGTAVGHTQVGDDYILDELGEMKNGVWIPADPTSLTYGTNGFRLQFKQTGTGTASTSTIGADTANSHHFTSTNLNDYDSNILDCPENNWCNFNRLDTSLDGANDMQFGNLAVQSSTYSTVGTNFAFKSGKWYFEFKQEATSGSIVWYVGILQTSRRKAESSSAAWGEAGTSSRLQPGGAYALYYDNGTEYKFKIDSYATKTTTALSGHPDVTGSGTSVGGGVVVGILIDMDSNPNTLKYNVDGANLTTLWSENFAFTIADDVTNIYAGQGDEFQVAVNMYQNRLRFNFGQDSTFAGTENRATNADENGHGNFHSAVPSGYLALCSANLPDPTIGPHLEDGNHADDFFKTVLYEGNGSARNITVGFQPDWLWFKNRDNTFNHVYYDSVRGPQTRFEPSQDVTEATVSAAVTDFTPSGVEGFSIGGADGATNQSGYSIAVWCWKLGGEPTADNSAGVGATPTSGSVKIDGSNKSDALAGTIAATRLSANTQSGVSIVTYTGNGSDGATIAHGLSTAPETVIVFGRDIANTTVIGTTGQITGFTHYAAYAKSSGYWVDDDTIWNDTAPTSTVFSVGTAANVNTNTKKYMAICMHHVDGFSRVGEISYAGNGSSTAGTFVHCGFKPAFVMVKKADGTGSWQVYDHLRTSSNSASDNAHQFNPRDERQPLDANLVSATSSTQAMDFTSSGFALRSDNSDQNGGSVPYYFMAFAQNQPFKYSNAE
mgnify:CR=1 FL=1|tara:strand:- start:773 stop:3511 length:2739 start_codon:yes stop_codon:yes gene_type:complete